MMQPTDKLYIQSINRALSLVKAISEGDGGLTLSELARPDLPISTAYRILRNLVAWQYVEEREDGRYMLGSELMRLGNLAQKNIDIIGTAHKHLRALGVACEQTVYLAMLDISGYSIYYADKIPATGTIQLSAETGTRHPIHSTANGKVLVSSHTNDQIRAILSASGMVARTPKTITIPETFLKEVESMRKLGYAIDDEENEKNVVCIAAPVYCNNEIAASISVSGIKNATMPADLKEITQMLQHTAKIVSELISY